MKTRTFWFHEIFVNLVLYISVTILYRRMNMTKEFNFSINYHLSDNLQVFTMSPPLATLGIQDDKHPPLSFKPALYSGSKFSSKSMISRIEHPLPSNRFKMNPRCLMDPPKKSRLAARFKRQTSRTFYSFNPAGQQCEKLVIPNMNTVPSGDNVYQDLESCQADCCPTALCKLMSWVFQTQYSTFWDYYQTYYFSIIKLSLK